ncbi:MAG: IS256 family transposase [Candidatus Acidiferrales bacterium]
MELRQELVDELLKDYQKPEDLIGASGLLKQLTKALIDRALNSELTQHLGYQKHGAARANNPNRRNGASHKNLKGDFGEVEITVPRDREGSFEPKIVAKHQTRWTGFDDKVLSMYARGMTTREIQGHLQEIYGVEVSPALISQVTEEVMEEVKAWQSRPLEPVYPIVYLDALYVKMRHEGRVENRAVYVAIGVNLEGRKEVLGLWTSASEGAKFWLSILTELRNRGVKDIFIACVDGLKGFPQAIESVFPQAQVQLCIVHLVRASLKYVPWKDRKQVAAELKPVYHAATAEQARHELDDFVSRWGGKYPAIGRLWNEQWERITPFFAFPVEIRKVIYTTNAVESLHMSLRKIIKNRGSFPSEESALKLLYLALQNASKKWETVQHWRQALNQFEILWGDRLRIAQRVAA